MRSDAGSDKLVDGCGGGGGESTSTPQLHHQPFQISQLSGESAEWHIRGIHLSPARQILHTCSVRTDQLLLPVPDLRAVFRTVLGLRLSPPTSP